MQCTCTVLYCYLWPLWLHHVIPHYVTHGKTVREKKYIEQKMCVLFSLQLLLETFLNLRRIQREITNEHRSTHTVHIILDRL